MAVLQGWSREELRVGAACTVVLVASLGIASAGCKSSPERKPATEASAKKPDKNVAKFRFDWPRGTALEAEVDRELRRAGGRSKSFHAGYRMKAERGDGEVRIRVEPKLDIGKTGTNKTTVGDALAAGSMIALPTIVAGPEGAFQSVEDVDATRKNFRKAVERVNGGPLSRKQSKVLQPLMKKEYLADRGRQFWSLLVGTWADSQMEIGETTTAETTDSFTFPMLGRREVKMELECTAEERVACTDRPKTGGQEGCVRLEMRSRPDVGEMKESMQAWVDAFSKRQARRQGMKKAPKLKVTNVFLRTNMTLVTEPETLVPHRFRQKKTVRLTLKAPSGEERSYRLVDERNTAFAPAR